MTLAAPGGYKSFQGLISNRYSFTISDAQLQNFIRYGGYAHSNMGNLVIAQADLDVAKVSPTILTIFRDSERELLARMGVAFEGIVHAEQEYEFKHALPLNQEIFYQSQIKRVIEQGRDEQRSLYVIMITDFFYRERIIASSRAFFVKNLRPENT